MNFDFAPTPIVHLDTDANGNALYVKREDLLPYSFGGNKLRIALEYLKDMEEKGCDELIAYGNARSNLCRVLSNLCCEKGIVCTVLSPADDDGSRADSYNLYLSHCFGARIVPCLKTDVGAAVDAAFAASQRAGRKPYYIYGDRTGQGNQAVPVRAYVKVYDELLAQERAQGFAFDQIALACGTGTTQAGLLCGAALRGDEREIVGVSIARSRENAESHVAGYVSAYLGGKPAPKIIVDDRFALSYGQYSEAMRLCARDALISYGLPLDMTYTGKAYYGLRRRMERCEGKRILFIHTGGAPLFFDQARVICETEE